MIRPLRERHYRTFVAIGFSLPIVFVLGILGRKPFPTMDGLADNVSGVARQVPVLEWERSDLFAKAPVHVRLLRPDPNTGSLAVTFSAARDYFIKPDLMVYWMGGQPAINDRLPGAAQLLGGFNSGQLPLPAEAAATTGVLVLFSLADHEVVEVSKPIQFNQPAR